ncbi:MAG TPA: hypothetical protein VFX49_13760, partial [Chloroflexota bacterium]|nr:hypothetical protein [Chloroflexota bacterium]
MAGRRSFVGTAVLLAGCGAAPPTPTAPRAASPIAVRVASPVRPGDAPIGFAAVAPSTTGGAGGQVITASSFAELVRALAAIEPLVIQVAGTIALNGMQ